MSSPQSLLVEIFVEELPPKALQRLGDAFARNLADSLKAQGLTTDSADVTAFASPRRLAAHVTDVKVRADDQVVRHKLMPVAVGLDGEGEATPALLKKLAALGADAAAVPSLIRQVDGKAEALFLEAKVPGATLAAGLQQALEETIARLPIPKVMRYQLWARTALPGWDSVQFVRPAHGLLALHGAKTVPVTVLGLQAGNQTRGHRFEASVDPISIPHADAYADALRAQGAVIARFDERGSAIDTQLKSAAARAGSGLHAIEDVALLDEVTALVERPNVLLCRFDEEFLAVPQECLILTMKANQKYFPLLDASGRLTNRFLVVSNVSPQDPTAVIEGNERVVRPRLADAKFFFEQDKKRTLESRVPGLEKVVYHNKLGSQGERSRRVAAIAHAIVSQLRLAQYPYTADAREQFDVLDSKVQQAARLAKTDLLTDMVGEFPELQGVMGGYYARHDGLRDGVAIAIEDHYRPRFSGDSLPRNHTGTVLALADKLETLVGMFGIGSLPTGEKDPFALRRHALGVIRLLVEKGLPLQLPELVAAAASAFGPLLPDPAKSNEQLLGFVYDRVASYLRDQGASAQEADAVIAARPAWGRLLRALEAVRAFAALPEAPALAAANKRIGNILKKAEALPGQSASGARGEAIAAIDEALLIEPAERALFDAMQRIVPSADRQFEAGDQTASLQTLAALRGPVDAFFDGVMVNADDAALRANRLALLAALHRSMNRVADLARLAG